jgi:hypothetical protein
MSRDFVVTVSHRSMMMLDRIITVDKTMVIYHMPATKKQAVVGEVRAWPPVKARVHASRTKQMLFTFCESRGLIYQRITPRDAIINANYTMLVVGLCMKSVKMNRHEMVARDLFFY